MASRATISIVGHSTTPEVKYLPDGTEVVSFSIATNAYSKAGDITSWWRVSVFGKRSKGLITLIEKGFFGKGTQVAVVGEVVQRPYTANDGSERMSLDVRAYDADIIFPPKNQNTNATADTDAYLESLASEMDELPF